MIDRKPGGRAHQKNSHARPLTAIATDGIVSVIVDCGASPGAGKPVLVLRETAEGVEVAVVEDAGASDWAVGAVTGIYRPL